ncbi:MAG: hypothetical protein IJE85_06875 [Bacteroidales bacterium]|nr:hypothetical protein [Bacteroidales bacterium]
MNASRLSLLLTAMAVFFSCTVPPVDTEPEEISLVSLTDSQHYIPSEGYRLVIKYKSSVQARASITKGTEWLTITEEHISDTSRVVLSFGANSGEPRLGRLRIDVPDRIPSLEFNFLQYGSTKADQERQRQALMDLYDATGGDDWHYNDNWGSHLPLKEWYGIYTDRNGSVTAVVLDGNGLVGELPESIGDLGYIDIYLSSNGLSGEVPSSTFRVNNIDLSRNSFTAIQEITDPDECFIRSFNLAENRLEGSLPEDITCLPMLYSADLSYNYFTGEIPRSYSGLDVVHIILNNNFLSGKIPQGVLDSEWFKEAWPSVISQKGLGFDLEDAVIPMPLFFVNDDYSKSSDIFAGNVLTAVVTSYSYTADSRIIDIVRDMYDAYQEDGFDVIFLGSRYALRDYPDPGWHYAYTSPKYWRYVQQHSLTTVTLVDSEGNVVVNPLTEDIDDVLEVMESVFGPVGGQIHPPLQGVAKTLQKASVGNGIDIVFLGDAFTADMIAEGIYDKAVSTAVEHIFADRTLRGLRDRFNIYSVSLPSRDGDYFSGASTVLGCWYGEDSKVGGDDELCRSYTASVVTEEKIDDALTIVLMNSERYGGTTYMYSPEDGGYGSGYAVAYIPLCATQDEFRFLLQHEAIGHGFAKLADEYAYDAGGQIPDQVVADMMKEEKYGWWKNVDFISDLSLVKWARFIEDERYSSEKTGLYEGGCGYWTGIWSPSWRSLMKGNSDTFNAPSREAIWQRIHYLSEGPDWDYVYEDFVAYDLQTSSSQTKAASIEHILPPPPVSR